MKWILLVILSSIYTILSIVLYLIGGQWRNWVKRYLLPAVQGALILVISLITNTNLLTTIVLTTFQVSYMGIWVTGEGWISKMVKQPWLVNVIYGLVSTIPLIGAVISLHTHWWKLAAVPAICGAFIPNLGSWGKIGKYDILGSDILRMATISVCWLILVLVK